MDRSQRIEISDILDKYCKGCRAKTQFWVIKDGNKRSIALSDLCSNQCLIGDRMQLIARNGEPKPEPKIKKAGKKKKSTYVKKKDRVELDEVNRVVEEV